MRIFPRIGKASLIHNAHKCMFSLLSDDTSLSYQTQISTLSLADQTANSRGETMNYRKKMGIPPADFSFRSLCCNFEAPIAEICN